MFRTAASAFAFFLFALLMIPAQSFAQTYVYPEHYLTVPPNYPQQQAQTQTNAPVVYPAQQYPTAQGHYLQLPAGYSTASASPPPPPVYVPPQSAYQQPQYQPQQYQPAPAAQQPLAANVSAAPAPTTLDQLPSYSYDRNLDPRYVPKPPAKELPTSVNHIGLGTETGGEAGLQVSGYRYQEFDTSGQRVIRITGPTVGVTLAGNKALKNDWFFGGDLRVAYGLHDYTGGDINLFSQVITPSTHNDLSDILVEARFLGGKDFIINGAFWNAFNLGLSPYIGLGFRFLYNDSRGADSNGVSGYERFSHYFYLPIGITPRVRLTENLRLSMNMEFDELLYGWQVSSLGEAIPGETDLTNTQNTGYGLRGSVMFEWPSWGLGPFFNFWDIGQSNTKCGVSVCGVEPHNQTIEFGFQGKYRF